jgi:hypothetical protein
MHQRNLKTALSSSSSIEIQSTSGLSVSGMIVDRTRRMVPRDNPTTEIVTYTIQDSSNRKYYVDDYAPSSYHELNSDVSFPIYIKSYLRKNGDPSYTLHIQKLNYSQGEHF